MHSSPLRIVRFRRFSWLLWLALVLPIGQTAALCHGVSHFRAHSGDVHDKAMLDLAHCDQCLEGAALVAGGLRSIAPDVPHGTARHVLRRAFMPVDGPSLFVPAYRSRAPPFASA